MSARTSLAPLLSLPILLLGAPALAAEAAPPAVAKQSVEFSAGARMLVGGGVWSTPTDKPAYVGEGLGFTGNSGGFGWGAGAYGEARFLQHLGLQLGLGYDKTRLQRDVTYNQLVKTTERVDLAGLRLELLVKGVVAAPFGRLWLGLGPEFTLTSSATPNLEITSGDQYVANKAQLTSSIHADAPRSTRLMMGLGMVFEAGDLIEIPLELRASRNLGDDTAWSDRVTLGAAGTTDYTVHARSSWDFRLALGVGVHF